MEEHPGSVGPTKPEQAGYEAPQVERVMDADDLAREVQYAGRPEVS